MEFSAPLQELELDLAKYANEFRDEKAISDEDYEALLMVENSAYVLDAVEQYLNTLGHKRVTLQLDAENAPRNVAWAIQKRMGADEVKVREAPFYPHQTASTASLAS